MKVIAVIPVRLESTRLPEKALIPIEGKPMLMHVYDNAKACKALSKVVIATDSEKIQGICQEWGAEYIMTGKCSSGTERVFKAIEELDLEFDIVINIQGDEPLIQAKQIEALIAAFENAEADIATLAEPMKEERDNEDPNTVKLIFGIGEEVQDFTRLAVSAENRYKHVGLYAFRRNIIDEIQKLPITERRKKESLEQLDWLLAGYKIYAKTILAGLISVDTKEDLDRVKKILEIRKGSNL